MVPATSNVLKASRLHLDDIDWWYVHESSAAAVLAWAAELGVPLSKVNPEGGELATTSPLGAVGAGLFASAAARLASGRGERVGLCVAAEAGVGVACVLEQAT
jgi:acetyl-CoA acetyltransferase